MQKCSKDVMLFVKMLGKSGKMLSTKTSKFSVYHHLTSFAIKSESNAKWKVGLIEYFNKFSLKTRFYAST